MKNLKHYPSNLDEVLQSAKTCMDALYLAQSSQRSYLRAIRDLCLFSGKLPCQQDDTDLYRFLEHLNIQRGASRETVRIYLQGIRFVFRRVYGRIDIIDTVPYPRQSKRLPIILSEEEVSDVINSAPTLKQRMILKIAYSGGLRRSEICRLKLTDIDISRKLLRIENSKGNKDRYTLLAKSLIPDLLDYYEQFQPEKYLIEGKSRGLPCSDSTISIAVKDALERSSVKKKVSIHSFRHAFASHLLSKNIDLFTIQKLLGHDDIRTTMVYMHLNHLEKQTDLVSPLDYLAE